MLSNPSIVGSIPRVGANFAGQPLPRATPQANSKDAGSEGFGSAPPSISLPKGGGAIRGIGEKFGVNPATGTGSLTVPLALSPGRSGFGPTLSLSYDSGAGNGSFGFGWNVAIPSVTRKTDKGLPLYRDAEESDVFILSDAEDLVPVLKKVGTDWERDVAQHSAFGQQWNVHRYRPRIEGLFARIEHWRAAGGGESHWRATTRDNVTSLYGRTASARIADPADHSRIFKWLLEQTYDDKGNVIVYGYKEEDSKGVDLQQVNERNRSDATRSANRYLKHIRYGNKKPYQPGPTLFEITYDDTPSDWLFEILFDYGEHVDSLPIGADGREFVHATVSEQRPWPARKDAFSTYRAGFEVRTYRLCRRALMFHHFSAEAAIGANCLVRSTDFRYSEDPVSSFITSITHSGYRRSAGADTFYRRSLPPIELEYSQVELHDTVYSIDHESLQSLPIGLDDREYQWVDLDGEGLSGILAEQGGGWFYKRNLSPDNLVTDNGAQRVASRFSLVEQVASEPALALAGDRAQFMDLAGDGQLDLVTLERPVAGFYERTAGGGWERFIAFKSLPDIVWNDPNLRFLDLTGDGHADALITEDEVFTWYPSLAEDGFGPAERVHAPSDEEKGPRVVFANGTQSIFLADMSGDGLTDLVRIRNGEVCYWPNLGYGRFGAKVTMDQAPWFDVPDLFDQRRIRLGDIDGSGTTDLFYLGTEGVAIYRNQSGNSWTGKTLLSSFPPATDLTSVKVVDLLGNGTACLVSSSPLSAYAQAPMRYIDLMGGQKPHLLIAIKNNLGAETRVQYASATKFYVQDRRDGRPWLTRLPFPVHVVERSETYDWISRNHFVSRYAYHHGCFDGAEREFRGFGMIERWDTEKFAALSSSDDFPAGDNIDATSNVPPVLTRTWFHTGIYLGRQQVSNVFAGLIDKDDSGEYYREPGLSDDQAKLLLLDDTPLPDGLTIDEEGEACRALKGSMLRQEVYGLDGTAKAEHPYSVTEQNLSVRLLQPQAGNRHAVFFIHPREALSYHYERNPADPRTSHSLTLEVDAFGNVLKSVSIGYGRRESDLPEERDQVKQTTPLVIYTENEVTTNPIDKSDAYRTPVVWQTRSYELTGYEVANGAVRFTASDFVKDDNGALAPVFDSEIAYEASPAKGRQRRLIEHTRTLFRQDDLAMPLAPGVLGSLGLPFEAYRLALTPTLVSQVYANRVTDDMLASEGGYVHGGEDVNWWIPSGRVFFSANPADSPAQELALAREHFFLPLRFRDPFQNDTTVEYDDYDLLVLQTKDALLNTITVGDRDAQGKVTNGYDYRLLQPALVTDPNLNRAAVVFDALGMVAGTAVMGKSGEILGDSLQGFTADLDDATVAAHIENPVADPHAILARATTRLVYDLFAYQRTQDGPAPQPALAYVLARATHDTDLAPGEKTKVQHSFSYSDGFGREIQKKIQAEPGPLQPGGPLVTPRWVGSGWTIFNNKGKPVRQYEPFFSATHGFESAKIVGVSPILLYDTAERVVATVHPDHSWAKVRFDPWRQASWDGNDTVTLDPANDGDVGSFISRLPSADYKPTWHEQHVGGTLGPEARQAAEKAAVHGDTPTIAHADALGRTFLTIAHNRFKRDVTIFEEDHATRVLLDIEGNQREVIDAKDRIVMRYDYDMLGNRVHQASMEAGERWMLNDVTGKPIRAWDSRGHAFRTEYDVLRRPLRAFVKGADPQDPSQGILFQKTEYGEGQASDVALNLRTGVFKSFDGAGVVTNEAWDFKGNLLRGSRELAVDYKSIIDWSVAQPPGEVFSGSTTYDALNRAVTLTTPDKSVTRPSYNEANLLESLEVSLRGATAATTFIAHIDYDAKGQRAQIEYGNGAKTSFTYDPQTLRLVNLKTLRGTEPLQELSYTYDPAGNITHIQDDAQQTIFFDNAVVEPHADYAYDAVYRLIEATGREHIGQLSLPQSTWNDEFRVHLKQPGDGQAMRPYTERFVYDAVGNFLQLVHQANNGAWTREYTYDEASLVEPAEKNNRLSGTKVGGTSESYSYDPHGSMLKMPHLPVLQGDFHDQLRQVDLGGGGTAYYAYDASGQRVRKVIERQNGTRQKERVYLGGFEIYLEYDGGGDSVVLARETLHVTDDTQRVALIETRTQGSDGSPPRFIRYELGNHLGSASLELDVAGDILSYEEYTSYGSTSYQAASSQTEVPAKRYRYTGKERDEGTGFYYHGARYYAPWLGRWTSCDPAGITSGINSYSYGNARPIVLVDSAGALPEWAENLKKTVTPIAEGAVDKLEARGKAIVEGAPTLLLTPIGAAAVETIQRGDASHFLPAVGEKSFEMISGPLQVVKSTGEGFGNLAYYAAHPEGKTEKKVGAAAVDAVLGVADIVTMGEGAKGTVKTFSRPKVQTTSSNVSRAGAAKTPSTAPSATAGGVVSKEPTAAPTTPPVFEPVSTPQAPLPKVGPPQGTVISEVTHERAAQIQAKVAAKGPGKSTVAIAEGIGNRKRSVTLTAFPENAHKVLEKLVAKGEIKLHPNEQVGKFVKQQDWAPGSPPKEEIAPHAEVSAILNEKARGATFGRVTTSKAACDWCLSMWETSAELIRGFIHTYLRNPK